MSELQIDDDPDPLPNNFDYPVNMITDLAYEGHDLSADLAEQERIGFEQEATTHLSEAAKAILRVYGEGDIDSRHAYIEGAELHLRINGSGTSIFGFIDAIDDRTRCRAWVGGGNGVSWCDDEQRYEPAGEVMERLKRLFPIYEQLPEQEPGLFDSVRNRGQRLKRALAMAILR